MFSRKILQISIISIIASQALFANINLKSKQNNIESEKIREKVVKKTKNNILAKFQTERNTLKKIFLKMKEVNILINNKKYNKAEQEIINTLKTLDKLLSEKNIPKIFPIGAASIEYRYIGNIKDVKKYMKISEIQFKEKNLVATRTVLDALRDEIDTRVFYVPLLEYKNALKIALKYMKEKKYKIAQSIINNSSKIIYIKQYVKPIPVLMGVFYINHAKAILHISKQRALQDIDRAKKVFKRAYILGYIPNKSLYEKIINDLNKIKKQIKTKNEISEKLYNQLMKKDIFELNAILNASSDFLYVIKNTKIQK